MSLNSNTRPGAMVDKRLLYRLRLFVAGEEPNSVKARKTLACICKENPENQYEIKVVDVFENYQAAIDNQVIVIPTLIREAPLPVAVIVGSLCDKEKLRVTLGLNR